VAEPVERFLANACPDHRVRGGSAHRVAKHTAEALLRQFPGIARHSIHAAVVCGELDEVRRMLREDPTAARRPGGPKGSSGVGGATFILEDVTPDPPLWEPLLYLGFARLDHDATNENALAIAELLLDHGADSNASFMAGDSRYTPLTGVIGEGEEERLPHPRCEELTRLLLERGAEPYDMQVVYNIHFRGRVLWFLKLMHARSIALGRDADWADPSWSMLAMGNYGNGARWHLDIALEHDDLELAAWCLDHGADPNAAPATDRRFPRGSLLEEALKRSSLAIARLLEQHGAKMPEDIAMAPLEHFTAAAVRLHRPEAVAFARSHPEVLRSATALHLAAERNRADVVRLLLELGVPPSLSHPEQSGEHALHTAAYWGSVEVAKLLIAHGAEVDPRESRFGATPLGFAVWAERPGMIELLGTVSRDVWNLSFTGQVARLRELLEAEPALARSAHADGETPIMRLTPDEPKAMEIVRLFLAHGADAAARNADGRTAADLATLRGMNEVASLLAAR